MNPPFSKVMKFGGSCLGEGDALRRLAAIVAREASPPALVVSALPGVTDRLLEATVTAERRPDSATAIAADLTALHLRVARKIAGSTAPTTRLEREIALLGEQLERSLLAVAFGGEVTAGLRATVASIGERWSARLVAAALEGAQVRSMAVDADRLLVTRGDAREDARVDLAASKRKRAAALGICRHAGALPVFTGFFGATVRGQVATFGRNGSDYSAAVLAVLLGARELEIWKDVPGFATADPKLVSGTHPLPRLTFAEAAELAYFGAAILHPRTLEPLAGRSVRLRLRSIHAPAAPGTEIDPEGSFSGPEIKSVSVNPAIAVVRAEGPGVGIHPGVIGRTGDALAGAGINIVSILTAQTSINLLVARDDAERSVEALRPLVGEAIERLSVRRELSLLAVVGEGMSRQHGVAGRIFSAVSRAGVNVEMIVSGASDVATYFLVRGPEVGLALRALHRELFP
ncbi:MAG TPA: aspartate kinase [Candidatus Aminicenantes bacterium]|nr:aspartate kinase [Candidatus Aminicenantes bacterium]